MSNVQFALLSGEFVFRQSAMYPILFHAFVLMNMLRAKGMVFAQDHAYAQQHHCYCQNPYCQQYRFHHSKPLRLQRYCFFCTYANI